MDLFERTDERRVPYLVRAVAAVTALVVVAWMVLGAFASYRDAVSRSQRGSRESTQSPSQDATDAANPATGSPSQETAGEEGPAAGVAVVVLIDGLNLRERPSTGSAVVKRLTAGQRLLLIEKGQGWYHVRDVDGSEGWVAAGGSYTRLEE
ncbi:MAG: SH3 domain-containing protein [Anaerosomatales bacterium]|nr:SH3 domain-containing protein [Anaerosomatales bacterium]